MRVLGIDPALAGPTGYGVVDTDGRNCRSVHFGALRAASKTAGHEDRLREIHTLIARLMEQYKPDAVAIEGIFAALNMKTALKLAEVRGVVMLAAAQGEVPVHSYSPREVKSCVAGYGNAGGKWQEIARTIDVSRMGVAVRMRNRVNVGLVVHVTLPLPAKLRSHGFSEPGYNMYAIVRRIEPPVEGDAYAECQVDDLE